MIDSRLVFGKENGGDKPYLSILIPTYKRSNTLYKAIDSAINQKGDISFEVVVVSNDPEDSLTEIVDRYKSHDNLYIYQNKTNIGMVRNSNRCVELAKGEYIAFLHDDDYLLDNYLQTVSKYIKDNSIKCLITGRYMEFEKEVMKSEIIKKWIRTLYFFPSLYRKKIRRITVNDSLKSGANIYYSPSCGTVISRDIFLQMGGFDNSVPYSYDLDFFLRLNIQQEIFETTEICAVYRKGDNASQKPNVKYEFYDYYKTKYFEIVSKADVDKDYMKRNRNKFLYTVYKQQGEGLKEELQSKGEIVEEVGFLSFAIYRLKTALYFYNHNLDIQRLRIARK